MRHSPYSQFEMLGIAFLVTFPPTILANLIGQKMLPTRISANFERRIGYRAIVIGLTVLLVGAEVGLISLFV